jgi:hypothetical protein
MEFGQKVGRRVGATIALGVTTLGIGALPVLFSKKKKHYLTVSYQNGSANEVAVFELAKDVVKTTLPVLEARTGKKIAHEGAPGEDDYARTQRRAAALPAQTVPVAAPATATATAVPVARAVQPVDAPPTVQERSERSQALQSKPPASASAVRRVRMSNDDVVKMTASGVSEEIILAAIQNSEPHFTLSPPFLEAMMKRGVSDGIIKAMAARQNGH